MIIIYINVKHYSTENVLNFPNVYSMTDILYKNVKCEKGLKINY